jgi:hypothetical protein
MNGIMKNKITTNDLTMRIQVSMRVLEIKPIRVMIIYRYFSYILKKNILEKSENSA